MWNLIEKSSSQSLTKLIRLLEHYGLKIISWLKGPRSLKQNCFKLELNWRGLPVQNLMRCLTFRNLLLIELVWGMIFLLLILLLLVLQYMFVSPANNVNSENNVVKTILASENTDKSKSILGAPTKHDKKETRNPRTKKGNNQKYKKKK